MNKLLQDQETYNAWCKHCDTIDVTSVPDKKLLACVPVGVERDALIKWLIHVNNSCTYTIHPTQAGPCDTTTARNHFLCTWDFKNENAKNTTKV